MTRRHMIALSAGLLCSKGFAADAPLVFAAASLKTVLDDIAQSVAMRLNYAGSGVLARQINQGAPADLFISANPEWTKVLFDMGRLSAAPTPLISNRLVIIAAKGTKPITPPDLQGAGRIAMGLTHAVPAGKYARNAFETLGLWQAIGPQAVQTENVRAALALVSRGEVPWGVVYRTDALADPNVDIVAEFDARTHPQIIYEAGIVKGAQAEATLAALTNTQSRATFERHGFIAL